jgi:hypothetical protein
VRVDPDDHLIHPGHLLASLQRIFSEDGQRYFELGRPFLSHAPPRHPAKAHAMKSHTRHAKRAARNKSAQPSTSPEPAPAQAV